MAIFKCKICGGSLEIDNAQSVATCEYCGTKQTLPKLDNERRANLYDRANHFRRNNDFDKAMGIYENILNEDNTDAEAYWSIVLCRYGIEYVEDPATRKRVPTVNRAQFTSIFDDEDYKSAIANADSYQREIYEEEATVINEIQKGILAISQKEEPFDVFVCYKETDASGRRTQDSVLATELYHELTREGFKVFFSRITLEDKLGVAYEPYIFAALHSAKVMVVLGTRPEHFNAVWVKNEWSRFLALIKNGAKKTLIPAYRDMDPYDLPEEFSHLQAQDMSKLGFMQDLTRGIKKIVEAEAPKATVKETIVATAAAINVAPLLKRAFMFLEDGDFDRADEFCEQVLNQDPENAQAYLGKLMAELHVKRQADLANCAEPFDNNKNYQKAVRFADSSLSSELKGYVATIKNRNAKKAEEARKESIYLKAMDDYKSYDISRLQSAINAFTSLGGYKDSDERIRLCHAKIDQIKIKEENDRIERERLAEEKRIADEKARLEKQRQAEIKRIETEKKRAAFAKKAKITAIVLIIIAIIASGAAFIVYQTSPASKFEYTKNANGEIIITGIKNESKAIKSDVLTVPKEIFGAKVIEIRANAFEGSTFSSINYQGTITEWNMIKNHDAFKDYLLKHQGECDFSLWLYEEGFDCTKGGKQIRYCNACKLEETKSIGANEHTSSVLSAVPPTCIEAGLTEGAECAICKTLLIEQQIIEAMGHTSVVDKAKDPTCTQTGLSEGAHCSVCKAILVKQNTIKALGHSYGNWQVTEAATCTQSGSQKRVCSVCNGTDTSSIPAKGHSYNNKICSVCKEYKPSEGLTYSSSGNGYKVSGIGTCSDTILVIPITYNGKTVNGISNNAFKECSWITKIIIPEGVTSIGAYAFAYCDYIEEVIFSDSVKTIGAYAFHGCDSLKYVTFGSGLETVYEWAFMDCRSMQKINIRDLNAYAKIKFELFANPLYCGGKLYLNGAVVSSITLPSTVKNVGDHTFEKCGLTKVVLSEGIESIGYSTFSENPNLTSVYLPSTLKKIDSYAFDDCNKLSKIYFNGTTVQWRQLTYNSSSYWDKGLYYDCVVVCTDGTIEP